MLTAQPTEEMISEWKRIYTANRNAMQPNRRSGQEVDAYFRSKYPFEVIASDGLRDAVYQNIMRNDWFREKLPAGEEPEVRTYRTGDVLAGIDLVTGFFQVECEDAEKMAAIYDDLFVYRGLDAKDLENFYLTAEYIRLTEERV